MYNRYIYIVLSLILPVNSVIAQNNSRDTIYIYDEVIVYDTVYELDTIISKKRNVQLEKISSNEPVLKIGSAKDFKSILKKDSIKTATISENDIILIKNKKSMKKMFLIGTVVFTMQNAFSQTEYEFSVGGGSWFQSGNIDYAEKPASSLANLGIYIRKYFMNEKLAVKTGFSYGYLFKPGNYSYKAVNNVFAEKMEVYDLNQYYGLNYNYYSVPVVLYYNRNKFSPFIGINYNNMASQTFKISNEPSNRRNISLNLGFNCGLEYRFNSFKAGISYTRNISKDYTANYYNGPLDRKVLHLRNNQIALSFSFVFLKKAAAIVNKETQNLQTGDESR